MLEKFIKTDFSSYEDFITNYKINVKKNFNFAYDVVDEWARLAPNKIALVWCDEKGNEATFTFAQLKYYTDKTANFFLSAGIKKGDPVMLILKRHYEFWFCIIALHKIGAICIPATHLLTKKDIVYRNNAADIKMIVAVNEENVLQNIDDSQPESPSLQKKVVVNGEREGWLSYYKELDKVSENFFRPSNMENISDNDIMLLYFTSGTTGMPKMVQHNFNYPLGHIVTAKFWQNVENDGLHLTVADTGWAKAAWGKIYGQWICGSKVFVYEYDRFNPKNLLEVISKYGVTSFCSPPTVYRYLIKEDLKKYDLSKLKYCTVAGEPLNPEVYTQFLNQTGIKLMEGYGQTECTLIVGIFPWIEPKPGSMGKPAPGYDIEIIDENYKKCEIGEVGQIVIKTDKRKPDGMFLGYYRDEELTNKVWHDNIYFTGDMAWRDEDGYFWFVGRADDVIKSSGYRIGPFEVESALLEHPAVLECAVTGVPDPDRGQIVKATIVLTKDYQASEELVIELQEHVKKVTAPYKYPRIIEFVKELPKTISGKIRRVEIRDKSKK
ncbi:MAG TPA: AMP-binding protein [Spirochaetota bacterium]|nr:AMP-binding protein [Spirochaetota bacterium]HPP04338.1 AMP-binding protein [Spirochaetota bacterium]